MEDGSVRYQNALTERNKPFFDAADAVFTNYWWTESHPAASAMCVCWPAAASAPLTCSCLAGLQPTARPMCLWALMYSGAARMVVVGSMCPR